MGPGTGAGGERGIRGHGDFQLQLAGEIVELPAGLGQRVGVQLHSSGTRIHRQEFQGTKQLARRGDEVPEGAVVSGRGLVGVLQLPDSGRGEPGVQLQSGLVHEGLECERGVDAGQHGLLPVLGKEGIGSLLRLGDGVGQNGACRRHSQEAQRGDLHQFRGYRAGGLEPFGMREPESRQPGELRSRQPPDVSGGLNPRSTHGGIGDHAKVADAVG